MNAEAYIIIGLLLILLVVLITFGILLKIRAGSIDVLTEQNANLTDQLNKAEAQLALVKEKNVLQAQSDLDAANTFNTTVDPATKPATPAVK